LCKKENIELIVYQSPIYKTRINYPSSMNFKLINNKLILSKDLFYDDIHVNAKGRNFCTLEFCKEITK